MLIFDEVNTISLTAFSTSANSISLPLVEDSNVNFPSLASHDAFIFG